LGDFRTRTWRIFSIKDIHRSDNFSNEGFLLTNSFCGFAVNMPVPIPTSNSQHGHHTPMSWSSSHSISSSESSSSSYPEIIRELASKGPQPYGTIPPRRRKKRRKSIPFEDLATTTTTTLETHIAPPLPPVRLQRRMSHVEDWVKVDSKETLPDDDELVSTDESIYCFCDTVYTQH